METITAKQRDLVKEIHNAFGREANDPELAIPELN
jgi:hypothetical protein